MEIEASCNDVDNLGLEDVVIKEIKEF